MTTSPTAGEMAQDMAIVEKHIQHAGCPVTIVWAVLMAATCVSWYLGDGHGTPLPAARAGDLRGSDPLVEPLRRMALRAGRRNFH